MRILARLLAAWVALIAIGGAASAQAIPTADQTAIHAVIQTQLDAFKRGDFDAAYAVAAPALKVLYPNVQSFTSIIKTRYPQLLQPKSVVFGAVTPTPQGPVQHIFVTASDGRAWVANCSLQQQPDKSWLIAGYTIARDRDSAPV